MKRRIIVSILLLLLLTLPVSAYYWYRFARPFPRPTLIGITRRSIAIPIKNTLPIPAKNKQIIDFVEKHGKEISPTYYPNVCTEFVIGVLSNFTTLTKKERIRIRIITDIDIATLRKQKSPIVSGVYFALTSSGKGIAVDSISQVVPGDFVQFWQSTFWGDSGHCGIIHAVDLEKNTFSLYSSHPLTGGYGIQTFEVPEECYFVRLK